MTVYEGSCHCGSVAFRIHKPGGIKTLIDCNCSVCTKKGLVHTPVEDHELEIIRGEEELVLYQFHTKTAKYWFCRTCGVEPFHRSRGNPHRYSVNARCLDDFFPLVEELGLHFLDAQHHPLDGDSVEFEPRKNPYAKTATTETEFVAQDSPARSAGE